MRYLTAIFAAATLSGCMAQIPESGAPASLPDGAVATTEPLSAMIQGSSVSSQPLDGAPVADAATPATQGASGLSDEQDFAAVSARQSIESDAARLEQFQQNYQQVEPTALPSRPKGSSASPVQFALSTTNNVGQAIYSRSGLSGDARAQRNCGRYTSADFAQIAFLESGGPERDKHGIDPDGDGFACSWDPAPFRLARGGTAAQPIVEDSGVSAADLAAVGIATPQAPATDLNISTE